MICMCRHVMVAVFIALFSANAVAQDSLGLKLVGDGDRYQLLKDGKPFTIRGVGGHQKLELLKKSGGNMIRTWGVGDDTPALLDAAHEAGIGVCLGFWLGHERHGFDYNNLKQVTDQIDSVVKGVKQYKDHPAVYMWALGNEMEGFEDGGNPAIWQHVELLAQRVKELDPHGRPVASITAEIGGDRVKALHALCPSIDIMGINSYGGVTSIPERYRQAGGTKPYMVTEYGPPGTWEVQRTHWGAAPELTSTAKAAIYRDAYTTLAKDSQQCLGSFAFLWGFKQEATSTWFGMFLPSGEKTQAVDELARLWTGEYPDNRAPRIKSLAIDPSDQLEPGATLSAKLNASDPDGDQLTVRWVLMKEAEKYGTGGDAEQAPPSFPDAITNASNTGAAVKLPDNGGGYRLFAYVTDGKGAGAVANRAVFVRGPEKVNDTPGNSRPLPLVIYKSGMKSLPWVPSGWMGDTDSIAMDDQHADNPHTGDTCIRVAFNKGDGWGGVVWQDPVNDWGDQAGGYDLSKAQRLSFWARGNKGGEKVEISFGLFGRDKPFFDTGKGSTAIVLTKEWKQYTIDVTGKDMTRIKTGFCWVVAGQGEPLTFFLDDIQYE